MDKNGTIFAYLISSLAVYTIVYAILYRYLIRQLHRVREYRFELWDVLLVSTVVLMNVLVFNLCTYNFDVIQLSVHRILAVAVCLLTLLMWKKMIQEQVLSRDIEMVRMMSALKGDYYTFLKDSITQTNIRCHDMKYQIAHLKRQIGDESVSAALDTIRDSIDIYDGVSKSGNIALDIVLTEKSTVCREKKIQFTYMTDISGLQGMKENDIYVLFGNLLDNAIEAVEKVPEEKRIIKLLIGMQGNMMVIQAANYFDGHIKRQEGVLRTTKKDVFAHGYGVRSMEQIMRRYDGEMKLTPSGDIFEVRILLPAMGNKQE